VASDRSICPGADSESKSKYQFKPGGKGDRCVRLKTYHLHVPIVKKSRSGGLFRPVMGHVYLYLSEDMW